VVVEKATRRILCVHTTEGKRHDYRLLKDSRVRLKKETKAVLDSGYQGAQKEHANTVLPLKKPKGGQLTKEQKCFNKSVAQERIVNENVIGSIKRFKIIAERYRNRRKRYGLRVTLIAAIHNFELDE
jgi:IS5 family transposase